MPTWGWRLLWIGIAVLIVSLGTIALDRALYNYNTETDYLGGFVPEASRLLDGAPLEIEFHPPLYPAAVAAAYALLRDWLDAGLLLSLASSLAVLSLSVMLFRRVLGPGAAVGAAIALAISPTFLAFSMQASSDVFSLAVYVAALLVVWWSAERRTVSALVLAGLVVGLALLARTNHIVLIGLLLFYLLPVRDASRPRGRTGTLRTLAIVAIAVCLPLAAWAAFAGSTGAPLLPTKNHENLALTYFGEDDRISGDARLALAREYSSTLDVLTEDPVRIARIYVRDLVLNAYRLLARDTVLPFPIVVLGLLAWLLILLRDGGRRAAVGVLLLNVLAMALLVNFKAYEHRYYLFLVPFVGAAIGHVVGHALERRPRGVVSIVAAVASVALVGYGAANALSEVPRLYANGGSEDAHAASRTLAAVDASSDDLVYARKPHIAFYAGVRSDFLPPAVDVTSLVRELAQAHATDDGRVFIFYGGSERRTRSQFAELANPAEGVASGLRLVGAGDEGGGWTLYAFDRSSTLEPAPGGSE